MAIEFKLPELGENIESIQVVRVMVGVGDAVSKEMPILELETDKATIEVPSSVAGIVTEIHVSEGDEVGVGQLILSLEGSAQEPVVAAEPETPVVKAPTPEPIAEPVATPVQPTPTAPSGPVEFKLPELGENIESIQVVRVMVSVGDSVEHEQSVVELETDKATIEVPSTIAGSVTAVHVSEGDEVSVGQLLFTATGSVAAESIETQTIAPAIQSAAVSAAPEAPVATAVSAPVSVTDSSEGRVPAAPSIRRFAREIGIVLRDVPASGPNGRVSKDDVKRYAKQLNTSRALGSPTGTGRAASASLPPLPDFSKWGDVDTKKMSVIRYKTAEHMALSWSQVPHVTIYDKADITELDVLRKQYKDLASKQGGNLTMAVMVCKIVAQALAKFPAFNASVDMAAKKIIYKSYVNLGVAVSTPRGLMVPVIRDADKKNMIELAAEIQVIAGKCREGQIQLDDLEGGSFTVTNLGRVCGTHFTPIINYPEVAILGIGRSYDEPLVVNGEISKRTVLPLSLSFDHRVIDGNDGASFMGWIKSAIEQPLLLALEG